MAGILGDLNVSLPKNKFGNRLDGTPKSTGFLGELFSRDATGRTATELSTSFHFDGKEVFMPLLVPTLTDSQVEALLSGKKLSKEMQRTINEKVQEHAFSRIRQGKSPFFNEGVDSREEFPVRKRFIMQKPRKILNNGDVSI